MAFFGISRVELEDEDHVNPPQPVREVEGVGAGSGLGVHGETGRIAGKWNENKRKMQHDDLHFPW